MKFLCILIISFLLIVSCSKSPDNNIGPNPTTDTPTPFDSVERKFGIQIKDKVKLNYTNHFISSDSSLLSISASKDETAWSVVYDLKTKKSLFDHSFVNDPDGINIDRGNLKNQRSWLEISAKTNTHLYGERVFQNITNKNIFRASTVLEMKSNKVINSDFTKSSNHMVRPWFNNTVLIVLDNSLNYIILGDGNKTIIEGSFPYSNQVGTAVSMNTFLYYVYNEGFLVGRLDRSYGSIISFRVTDNFNDRAWLKTITSDGNIATAVFVITSSSNKVSEKTVKVDFHNQKIISVLP